MDNYYLIEKGREYAYGILRSADPEKAYEIWSSVSDMLTGEDRELYGILSDIFESAQNYSARPTAINKNDVIIKIAYTNPKTENEVRELFECVLIKAKNHGDLDKLYGALKKHMRTYQSNNSDKKKPENVRFGNNLGFLLYNLNMSPQKFLIHKNLYRRNRGLPEKKSVQGIYSILAGLNSMDDSDKIILIEMANEPRRNIFKEPLKITDMFLSMSEFISLFRHPVTDEKTQDLLNEEKRTE